MEKGRAIIVKFVPATNTKPSRVVLTDARNFDGKRDKVTLSFHSSKYSRIDDIANEYLTEQVGISVLFSCYDEKTGGYILVTNDLFTPIK